MDFTTLSVNRPAPSHTLLGKPLLVGDALSRKVDMSRNMLWANICSKYEQQQIKGIAIHGSSFGVITRD